MPLPAQNRPAENLDFFLESLYVWIMKAKEIKKIQEKAVKILQKAQMVITPEEKKNMEVAEFGLNDVENIGLELIIYVNNDRYCAKELMLLPRQICPEHRHPRLGENNPGKRETFRCRWGEVYLYVEGPAASRPQATVPAKYQMYFTVWNEIVLLPGQQVTLEPNTLHWFQSGDQGAVVSEFSSTSADEMDLFTDPHIKRVPEIE